LNPSPPDQPNPARFAFGGQVSYVGLFKMSKKVLRTLAWLLLVAALALWVATGANRGWTKTSVPVKRTDEVTGITVDDYQKRFVPGIDFLGAALLASGILAGVSFLFSAKQNPTLTDAK
jgi:hypothetical protein